MRVASMPPKTKKGPKAKQKLAKEPERPSWLSDEAWKMSKDVPKLVEKLRVGADKTSSGVSRAQVACNILGLLPSFHSASAGAVSVECIPVSCGTMADCMT